MRPSGPDQGTGEAVRPSGPDQGTGEAVSWCVVPDQTTPAWLRLTFVVWQRRVYAARYTPRGEAGGTRQNCTATSRGPSGLPVGAGPLNTWDCAMGVGVP